MAAKSPASIHVLRIKPLPSGPVIWGRVEWLTVMAFLPLAVFDLWLLWRVIVPNL